MKSLLVAIAFLTAGLVQAQSIYYKSIPTCTYWTSTSSGYLCSGYPSTEYFPDRFSLDTKINLLESRIAQLEAQIANLQPK